MTRTIVVLGAAVCGVPITHYLLKHTIKKVPDLRVVLVSPNSHFYWNLAVTRGVLPRGFDDDKLFYDLQQAFADYPPEKFRRIQGKAIYLDPIKSEITVRSNAAEMNSSNSHEETLSYHAVIVATGTSARDGMPWKNLDSTTNTKKTLATYRRRIDSAKTIVVAGSGATGCELAGELGTLFGRTGEKKIVLVSKNELPLDNQVMPSVRNTVKAELESMKIVLKMGTRVVLTSDIGDDGRKRVHLLKEDGTQETVEADVYLPTLGVSPNTDFLRPELLDSSGFMLQSEFLRSTAHDNMFVVGDVGNLENCTASNADNQTAHVVKNIEAFLTGTELSPYEVSNKVQFGLALGNRGTGQTGTWKLWSVLIWFVKGRYLGTQYAADMAAGKRTMHSSSW